MGRRILGSSSVRARPLRRGPRRAAGARRVAGGRDDRAVLVRGDDRRAGPELGGDVAAAAPLRGRPLVVAGRHVEARVRGVRAGRAGRRGGGGRAAVLDARAGRRANRRSRGSGSGSRRSCWWRRSPRCRCSRCRQSCSASPCRRGCGRPRSSGSRVFVALLGGRRDADGVRSRGARPWPGVDPRRDAAAAKNPPPPTCRSGCATSATSCAARWARAGGRRSPARPARWLFDWLTLVTALAAVGQHPRPTLVLLAFCAAQLLAQIPITPGGLGVVEAGLTGSLVLIGVPAGAAAVATLAYRLVSYWLALPAGGDRVPLPSPQGAVGRRQRSALTAPG